MARKKEPATNSVVTLGQAELAERYAEFEPTFDYRPFPRLRCLLAGPGASGKSTLMLGRRRTLYLDFDGGAHRPPGAGTLRVHVDSPDTLDRVMKRFRGEAANGSLPFDHVVFDTLDTFRDMMKIVKSEEIGEDITMVGKNGQGFDRLAEACMAYLNEVYNNWHCGWTCCAHLKWRAERDEDGDSVETWDLKVQPTLARRVKDIADIRMIMYRTHEDQPVQKVSRKTGKTKQVVQRRWVHTLLTTTQPDSESAYTVTSTLANPPLGSRVPMDESLVVPMVGGIDVLEDAYERAVQKARKLWSSGDNLQEPDDATP